MLYSASFVKPVFDPAHALQGKKEVSVCYHLSVRILSVKVQSFAQDFCLSRDNHGFHRYAGFNAKLLSFVVSVFMSSSTANPRYFNFSLWFVHC